MPIQSKSVYFRFLINLMCFFTISYANVAYAQIDIKSKIDAQTYSNYSRSIDLFESLVNPNDTITLFIPINFAFSNLSEVKQNEIFIEKKTNAIINFLSNHSAIGTYDILYFDRHLSTNSSLNKIELKSLNSIFFEKNIDKYLFGDSPDPRAVKFETHVVKTVYLNGNIVLNFLDGIFLF